jgi:hypothetical protein
MKSIDCSGKTCPLPVIEAKKVLEDKEVNEITVLVPGVSGVLRDGDGRKGQTSHRRH